MGVLGRHADIGAVLSPSVSINSGHRRCSTAVLGAGVQGRGVVAEQIDRWETSYAEREFRRSSSFRNRSDCGFSRAQVSKKEKAARLLRVFSDDE